MELALSSQEYSTSAKETEREAVEEEVSEAAEEEDALDALDPRDAREEAEEAVEDVAKEATEDVVDVSDWILFSLLLEGSIKSLFSAVFFGNTCITASSKGSAISSCSSPLLISGPAVSGAFFRWSRMTPKQ